MEKTSLVLGASGLIGRLLILDLLQKSNKAIAILRNDEVLPNEVEKLIINFDEFIIKETYQVVIKYLFV